MTAPEDTVISARDVSKSFPLEKGFLPAVRRRLTGRPLRTVSAVDSVSFDIARGETVGIVGESGCGKTTLARMLAGISQLNGGSLTYDGIAFHEYMKDPARALKVQMIFQDPQSSLNSRMTVLDIVGEAPVFHGLVPRSQKEAYVREYLEKVGLSPDFIHRYPHQFSGGQRQRIGIARALAVRPDVLVCDESVAALDVSVQAQIINLLMEIRRTLGLTMLFISHDLGVIRHLCDRVIVMYLGRIVEIAPTEALFANPLHPYTRMLLDGMPRITTQRREFMSIRGEIPSPINPPRGCHFNPRCPYSTKQCLDARPPLDTAEENRRVACINWRDAAEATGQA